jgi:CDP-6-deoxy-D-xylo-4-hexulose-3-dehydrase
MNWERAILSDLILSETGAQERENLRGQILSLVKNFVDAEITSEFRPGEDAIPVSGKVLGSDEIQYMVEAALDGWLTTGRFNASFESGLANFLNVKHLRTVNSGSSANLVAFSSLTSPKLGERAVTTGDEVITVAAGFPTTVNPILQNGAVPVFLDIELGTYNIQADQIESAITKKTLCWRTLLVIHSICKLSSQYAKNITSGWWKTRAMHLAAHMRVAPLAHLVIWERLVFIQRII